MSCEEVFLNKLRERGFRLTPQREIILSTLHQLDHLATAEEIFEKVQKVSSAVDISTVYRTLDLLGEFNLVIASDLESGNRVFQLVGVEDPHLHLVCKQCGKTIQADWGPAEDLTAFLAETYGFQVDLAHQHLAGLCESCRAEAA
jgi:Fur family ferric uptake transcriptional regulator